MKKNHTATLLALCIALVATTGYSQSPLGIKAGVNLSNAKFDELPFDSHLKGGFYAGVLGNITIHKKVFIQPEFLYSLKGWRSPANGISGPATVNFHYLNLPLLIGYQPIDNLSILAGPELGFLISSNDIGEGFDLGLDLGVAYRITPNFGVEVRYNYGVKKFSSITFTDLAGSPDRTVKDGANRVLQFGVFYLLPKK